MKKFSPRLLLYALLLAPLLYTDKMFFGYVTVKTFWIFLISELLVLALVWAIFWKRSVELKWSWQMWVVVAYVVVLGISTLTGVYPSNSFWGEYSRNEGLLTWFHLFGIFLAIIAFLRTKKQWVMFFFVSICVAVVVGTMFFLTRWGVFSPSISDNGGGVLGNSSYLGAYLLFELGFASLLMFLADQKWMKGFAVFAFILLMFTLVSTDARAATLAFFGGTLFFVGLVLFTRECSHRWKRVLGGAIVGGLLVGFVFVAVSTVLPNGSVRHLIEDKVGGSRFVVGRISMESFFERPLFGWGPENFSFAFLEHYDPCFGNDYCGGNTLFDRSHNVILDNLVNTGVVGLLSYLMLIVAGVWSVWKAVGTKKLDPYVASLVTVILSAYVVQNFSFFDTTITLMSLLILLAFSVSAMSDVFGEEDSTVKSSRSPIPMIPAIATCLLPVTLFFFVIQPARAGYAMYVAQNERQSDRRYEAYQAGGGTTPFGLDVRVEYLGFMTMDLLWGFRPGFDQEIIQKQATYFAQEVGLVESEMRKTIARSPNDFRAYLYLTQLLHGYGRLYDAKAILSAHDIINEAVEKNPKFPRLRWAQVSILMEQGRVDEAKQVMREALELNNDTDRALWNTYLFAMYVEDEAGQEEALQTLLSRYPSWLLSVNEMLSRESEYQRHSILYEWYSE